MVSNSGHEQAFCLFDHMWKFGTSSANMHNEVAPERGPPPAAVAEERWKLFSLIEEGLTRRDAVASMLREQRVRRPGCFALCQDVLSSCATIPGVLPCRQRALREAVRVHRVRITPAHWQWRPSWWIPTPSCGGLACPTPSCTPQWRFWQHSSRQCSIPEWAWAFGSSPVSRRRCCWTCLFSARKPLRCGQRRAKGFFVTFVSVSANAIDAINAGGFFLKKNYSFWKFENKSPFVPRRTTFFSCVEDCVARLKALLSTLPRAVTLLSEWSLCTFSCHWSGPRWHPLHQAVFHLIFLKRNSQENKLNRKRSKREKTEQSFSTRFLRNILIFSEKKKEDDLKGRFGKKPQTYFQKRVSKKEIRKQLDFCGKRKDVWAKLTTEKKIIWAVQEHFLTTPSFFTSSFFFWALLLLFFMSCFYKVLLLLHLLICFFSAFFFKFFVNIVLFVSSSSLFFLLFQLFVHCRFWSLLCLLSLFF